MSGDRKTEWCDQEELAVGWAMHALEPDEEARLRAHLPECAMCTRTVRETEAVTAAVGESVDQYDPPARLKARLMEAIEHTPQEQPSPVVEVPDRQDVAEPISLDARRGLKAKRTRVLLAAAAVILVAAVTGAVGQQLGSLSNQVAEQKSRTDQLEHTFRLATDPATNKAVLRAKDGTAMAVLFSGDDEAVVVSEGMPANDLAKQTYVMWGTGGNGPVALATFDVRPGSPDIILKWDKDAYAHSGFAISLEPGRTAPASPSAVVAAGQVAKA